MSNGADNPIAKLHPKRCGDDRIVTGRVGSTEFTWQVKTAGGDPVPDAFDFPDKVDVAVSTQIDSIDILIQGLIGVSTATATGCELTANFQPYTSGPIW